jgi:insulysin
MTKLAEDIFKRLHITTLVHGNMEKEDAVELQKVIEDVLQPEPLTETEKASDVSLFLPEGEWASAS